MEFAHWWACDPHQEFELPKIAKAPAYKKSEFLAPLGLSKQGCPTLTLLTLSFVPQRFKGATSRICMLIHPTLASHLQHSFVSGRVLPRAPRDALLAMVLAWHWVTIFGFREVEEHKQWLPHSSELVIHKTLIFLGSTHVARRMAQDGKIPLDANWTFGSFFGSTSSKLVGIRYFFLKIF